MQTTGEDVVPRAVHEGTVRALEAKVFDLEARLAWFERQMFGAKSERFVPTAPGQLALDFGGDAELAALVEAAKQRVEAHERAAARPEKDHPGRWPLPADLPRKTETVEPEGGTDGLVRIGEDVTETLEYKAGEMWVRRVVRPRYARPEAEQAAEEEAAERAGTPAPPQVAQAPAPDGPFPRLKAGVSLLAYLLVSKFADHLPLYRIGGQLARQGLKLPDSTLGDWVKAGGDHLLPLYEVYRKVLFRSLYLQFDETTLKVLESGKESGKEGEAIKRTSKSEKTGVGKCHLGYLWAAFDPVRKLPFFFYQKGRDHKGPLALLSGFVGTLQCDGYRAYETLDKKVSGARLLGCLAHIRRKFFEAKGNDEKRAAQALAFIRHLYAVEEEARLLGLTHAERLELRQKNAKPVFDVLGAWIKEEYQKVLPASAIGKALAYAARRWDSMGRYLDDGSLEIDNNLVENSIRPAAIGRKNYLFAGNHAAAQRTAVLYTLIGACKQHKVNPEEWLNDVLGRMYKHPVNRLEELLPQNWKPAEKPQPAKEKAEGA